MRSAFANCDSASSPTSLNPYMVLHAVLVGLGQLTLAPVEESPSQIVAALLQVTYALDLAAVGLLVHIGKDVQRLEDPAVVGEGIPQRRQGAAPRQHAQHVVLGQ